jgi:RND family efflux transporter MFP subunit
MVGPTSPVLTLISADTEVVINVDERAIATLKAGQSATITTSAYSGEAFGAAVAAVAPTVDVRSRTAEVRLAAQDTEGKLRDGMFAQVNLAGISAARGTLVVPRKAIVKSDNLTVVYLIADGRAKKQAVTTGATDGDRIEIVDGLIEGQTVAVSGLSNLADGADVTVQ